MPQNDEARSDENENGSQDDAQPESDRGKGSDPVVALMAPAVRMVVIKARGTLDWSDCQVYPVVAIQATLDENGIPDLEAVYVDEQHGLTTANEYADPGSMLLVVACPWPRKKDKARLAEHIARLRLQAEELFNRHS
jgi:hypothetical protein